MEVELRKIWIDHRCGYELQKKVDMAIAELQRKYDRERDRRPPLESFADRRSQRM
jgi:hypothetical protein